MEEQQLDQINNLSKDELVQHINSQFDKQATSRLILAILWGIVAISSVFIDHSTSRYGILILWFLIFLTYFYEFLKCRKMSKEDSAKRLLTRYDKYKKYTLYILSIVIIILCYGIYEILAENHFAPNIVEWIFCIIFGLLILYLVWYLFSTKFRTKMDNYGRDSINRYVERLRELVKQEEGKSEVNV